MKRIVTSIGAVALGAACVQSANAQGDPSKPWTASVALRGFYDDNVNGAKHDNDKIDTFGFEVSPTLGFALSMDQTKAALVYTYSFLHYDKSPTSDGDYTDQTHTIAGSLVHDFNERTTVSISDSFVIGQEPDLLRSGSFDAAFQRISGQNVRNYGNLTLNHQFKPKFGMEAGYANSLFNYEDDGYAVQHLFGDPTLPVIGVNPVSNSGVLDRIEQVGHVDARWTIQPTTVGLIGYAFSYSHYTADQPIGVVVVNGQLQTVVSDDRDSRAHYVYAGAEHTFLPGLHGSLRAGARFTDYFNSPANESGTSPYFAGSLSYDYSKATSFQIGASHDLSATDVFSVETGGGSITTDAESTVVYASVTHRFLPSLSGTLMGQFQDATYQGGTFDGSSDQYYLLSASVTYQINRHIAATLSYNYDLLDSGIAGRGYDRNRIFLGGTFTY